MNVNLDESGVGGEEGAVAQPEVHALADQQNGVRLSDLARRRVQDRVGVAEAEGMLVGKTSAPHADGEAGQLREFHEPP